MFDSWIREIRNDRDVLLAWLLHPDLVAMLNETRLSFGIEEMEKLMRDVGIPAGIDAKQLACLCVRTPAGQWVQYR